MHEVFERRPGSISIDFTRRLKYGMREADRFDVIKCILQSPHIARPFFPFLNVPSFPSLTLRILFILTFHDFCGMKNKCTRETKKSCMLEQSRRLSLSNFAHWDNKLIHFIETKFACLIQFNISFAIFHGKIFFNILF